MATRRTTLSALPYFFIYFQLFPSTEWSLQKWFGALSSFIFWLSPFVTKFVFEVVISIPLTHFSLETILVENNADLGQM